MSTAALKYAVCKAIVKQFEEVKMPVGQQSFRGKVFFNVDVTLSRKEDILAAPTTNIAWLKVMAIMAKRAGAHKEVIKQVILDSMKESLDITKDVEEIEALVKEIQAEIVSKLPKVKRASPTLVKGIVRLGKLIPKKTKEEI